VFLRVQDPAVAPHIAGTVTDAGSGAPLAATVTAGIYSTATNPADGSYDMLVIAGTYDVTASAAEHTPAVATGVAAVSGSTTTVNFQLVAWPRIQGTVTEQGTGLPLAGTVTAGAFFAPTSAVDGSYDLAVEPGTYDVTAWAVDHAASTQTGVVAAGGATIPLDFQLRPMVTLLWDDVEGGNIGWTVDTANPGGTNWSIVTDGASNHAWFTSDPSETKDDRLSIGPFGLNEGTTLSFDHHWAFEGTSTFYDGAVLEVSLTGSDPWVDVLAAGGSFVEGGYTGTINASSNPLNGRQGWTGDSPGTVATVVDLSALTGQDLWFRYRFGSDSSVGDVGWYVDNILLQTATDAEPPMFYDGFESGTTDAWSSVLP
jgi:hypothetical protein